MKARSIALFLFSSVLFATLAIKQDIKTITENSQVVVDAEVVSQRVYQDAKGRIITESTLRVSDGMKGAEAGKTITLYQVGGEYHGRVYKIQGASVYQLHDRVILFAKHSGHNLVPYNFSKFQVVERDHRLVVREQIKGVEVVDRTAGQFSVKNAEPRPDTTLEAFKAEIRKALP